MPVIGEYNPDGTTKTEATECAATGQPVLGYPSVLQRIKGTNFFYRFRADFSHYLTPAKRAEIEALATGGNQSQPEAPKKARQGKSTGEYVQAENPLDAEEI